jgi:hypothetical protein
VGDDYDVLQMLTIRTVAKAVVVPALLLICLALSGCFVSDTSDRDDIPGSWQIGVIRTSATSHSSRIEYYSSDLELLQADTYGYSQLGDIENSPKIIDGVLYTIAPGPGIDPDTRLAIGLDLKTN